MFNRVVGVGYLALAARTLVHSLAHDRDWLGTAVLVSCLAGLGIGHLLCRGWAITASAVVWCSIATMSVMYVVGMPDSTVALPSRGHRFAVFGVLVAGATMLVLNYHARRWLLRQEAGHGSGPINADQGR